jgi:hypothetical protein
MKPAGKSRGRGIQVESTLANVLNVRGVDEDGERNSHWIVQKYIERPLIVHGRKWDIRQWVLVSSWNPLTIWVYDKCYLRFCSVPFTLSNLSNRFVHLSNNSIQKNSATFDASEIEGNMWHARVFAEWLDARKAEGAWDGLQVCSVIILCWQTPHSFDHKASALPLVQFIPDVAAMRSNCNEPQDSEALPRAVSSCDSVWEEALLPQLRRIIVWSLQAAQDRIVSRNKSFQIYGFDFMVDVSCMQADHGVKNQRAGCELRQCPLVICAG